MKVIIDRFEGNYAVCETEEKEMINIDKDKVPSHAKEGDVLDIDGDSIILDTETTIKRKKGINRLADEIWE